MTTAIQPRPPSVILEQVKEILLRRDIEMRLCRGPDGWGHSAIDAATRAHVSGIFLALLRDLGYDQAVDRCEFLFAERS